MKTVCVSGGMDPLHIGHIRHIEAAAKYGEVVVILNSDEWLKRKKGYVFQTWEERSEILLALKSVRDVVRVDDADGTVCEALRRIKPDMYAKGGDRGPTNTPELETCEWLGIQAVFGVGGDDKPQSSSWLVDNAVKAKTEKETKMIYEDKP